MYSTVKSIDSVSLTIDDQERDVSNAMKPSLHVKDVHPQVDAVMATIYLSHCSSRSAKIVMNAGHFTTFATALLLR